MRKIAFAIPLMAWLLIHPVTAAPPAVQEGELTRYQDFISKLIVLTVTDNQLRLNRAYWAGGVGWSEEECRRQVRTDVCFGGTQAINRPLHQVGDLHPVKPNIEPE